MNIGTIHLDPPTVLAPLAGITNLPLRLLAKQAGCSLVCSEMISANGLVHGSAKTVQLLASDPSEKPLSVQLFGADPAMVADAAAIAEDAGADMIDINCGCSVRKILKSGSGSALMRTPDRAGQLLTAVRRAIRVPLTIKIRSGWEPSGRQALDMARMAQDCGVQAIAVHPRTARQGFGGSADWALIAAIKEHVSIPVIGNGDIVRAEDALAMMAQTGCDAVMVGRAAIGNPFIFSQIAALLSGKRLAAVTAAQRIEAMRTYLNASVHLYGESVACRMMRSRLGWFVKGLPGARDFRHGLRYLASQSEGLARIDAFAETLTAHGKD